MRHLFIINPCAGQGARIDAVREKIESVCGGMTLDYTVEATERPLHASALVRKYAEKGGPLRVYACGGDGTLNEAVCGAAGLENVQVTHFPCGTGNDFIRMFGTSASRFSDLSALIAGTAAPVDLIDAGSRWAVNVFSFGFDARVSVEAQRFKKTFARFGPGIPYNLGIVSAALRGLGGEYEVEIDGKDYSGRYTLITAMNGQYYGGGFHPTPRALPDDGLLDFILTDRLHLPGLARMIGAYAKGQAETLPVCRCFRGKELRYRTKRPRAVNLDGEGALWTEGHIKLRPKALPFVLPEGLSFDMLRNTAPVLRGL